MPASSTRIQSKQERLLTATNSPTSISDPKMVAQLAYSYWEARGCEGGSPEEDWFRAEEELYGRMAQAA